MKAVFGSRWRTVAVLVAAVAVVVVVGIRVASDDPRCPYSADVRRDSRVASVGWPDGRGGRLFLVTRDRRMFVRDASGRWSLRPVLVPSPSVSNEAVGGETFWSNVRTDDTSRGLYVSRDDAFSWQAVKCWTVFDVSAGADGRVYVATVASLRSGAGGGLYRTEDGGRRWDSVELPSLVGITTGDVNAVGVSQSGAVVVAGTEAGGVYVSEDHGKAWRFEPMFPAAWPQADSISVGRGRAPLLWVGSRLHGILVRRIGAENWAEAGFRARTIWPVLADPRRKEAAYALVGSGAGRRELVRTADAGVTWRKVSLNGIEIAGFAVHPVRGDLVAWSDRSLYVSSDAGQTWTPIGLPAVVSG